MSGKLASMAVFISLLVSMSVVVFRPQVVEADSTIYIRADGSVDPSYSLISSVDNVTYTFLGNINDSIMVEKSHVVIDGAGYTLDGLGSWGTGIIIQYVAHNVTAQNLKITGFGNGISIINSWDNIISGNNITNNGYGVFAQAAFNTTFTENNIVSNVCGIWLENCSNNRLYHNYFIDNTSQVHAEAGEANVWNDDYPSGGNYWSNFKEQYPDVEDIHSGPDQDLPGSDGFWDGPYEINENNIDKYPIVPEFPSFTIVPLFMITTGLIMIFCRKK